MEATQSLRRGLPVQVRLHNDLLTVIDDWRREQSDLPSRPESIRRLLGQTLGQERVFHSEKHDYRNQSRPQSQSDHGCAPPAIGHNVVTSQPPQESTRMVLR